MATDIADARERSRFEISLDGEPAGFAAYRLRGPTIVFTHTEIDPRFEGRGLAGELVRFALDAARDAGLTVKPLCPYVAAYIDKHPEYRDLVAGS